MIFDLEPIIAIIIEFKKSLNNGRCLNEFEYMLYEAACDFLTKELKDESRNYS